VPASSDWPYIYVDDAADAAIAACFADTRKQLIYFLAYPEQVTVQELAAAAGLADLDIDASQPDLRRGPVDIGPAMRDFSFAPKVAHREGIRRMIAARSPCG
jgi:nucleoside-diphosphate-sugar epimerase